MQLIFRFKKYVFWSLIGFLFSSLLVGCGGEVAPTTAPLPVVPTPLPPTPTPLPPTPQPTATLNSVATTEWGSVKSTGAEVHAAPNTSSPIVENLAPFTILAWQNKLIDESWFERAGGGWVSHDSVVIYRSEFEARRGVPQITATPTNVPTYNPKAPTIGRANYTFAPVVGNGSVPQYITTAPPPQPTSTPRGTPPAAVGSPKPTTVPPTATRPPVIITPPKNPPTVDNT